MRRIALSLLLAMAVLSPAHAQRGALPPVTRHVPRHGPEVFAGCTPAHRALIESRLGAAIDVGAPAYNDGDFAGCYRAYESAARALEASLPNSCPGPGRALRDGRAAAAAATNDSARAWAMRDAFDGLLIALRIHPAR